MDVDQEIHLKLMQLLQSDPSSSQRELARELGISLGKVNYCLRALLDKGYVKAINFKNSRKKAAYLYVLTPVGVAAKARATVRFLRRKEAEHKRLLAEIEELRAQLRHEDQATCLSPRSVAPSERIKTQ
ncbi:MAG: MarR family EPS-associated transcriptional regulator [Ottowia sp.]|nr:MarR family EPS-associated transcriptional regulator [Ottowia sp.]